MEKILKVKDLKVSFHTYAGEVKAVRGVSFELAQGETLAVVGESGCGKSITAKSLMRLLPTPPAEIDKESKIMFNGKDILSLNEKEMQKIRGKDISMIFQDPMTSLNPTMKLGKQIIEVLKIHRGMNKKDAAEEAIRLLK
ncbi:MAG: ATP-binding cassette domain-containing protein, partial [Oscillospiraceae bacterium]